MLFGHKTADGFLAIPITLDLVPVGIQSPASITDAVFIFVVILKSFGVHGIILPVDGR
jgi:hypothetical protein